MFEEAGSLCHTMGYYYYCKTKITVKSNDDGMLYLSFYNPTDERLATFFEKCPDIMLAEGTGASEYIPYVSDYTNVALTISNGIESTTVTPNNDGNISVTSYYSPYMTISSNNNCITIECKYNVDTKLYIDNKIAELMQ